MKLDTVDISKNTLLHESFCTSLFSIAGNQWLNLPKIDIALIQYQLTLFLLNLFQET